MKTEFEFIENIRRRAASTSIKVGIGDDCAVIPKDSLTDLVITADLLVEDIDFRLDWTNSELLGHKSLAISLSDIASMGANPVWALLSIGIPQKIWKTDFVEKFYEGWFALAEKSDVVLIGGDVSRTPNKIVINSIAAGEIKKNKAILRSGAKPGDLIFVTGELGGAAAGLRLLEKGERFDFISKNKTQNLISRQLKPNPQIEIGKILAEKSLASAMIDLSDGLSGDLIHICRESGVGAKIFKDKIPIDRNLKNENADLSFSLALNGGEDFELLLTVNPKKIFQLEKSLKNFSFFCIGEITENVERIELITENGSEILKPKSFRHF